MKNIYIPLGCAPIVQWGSKNNYFLSNFVKILIKSCVCMVGWCREGGGGSSQATHSPDGGHVTRLTRHRHSTHLNSTQTLQLLSPVPIVILLPLTSRNLCLNSTLNLSTTFAEILGWYFWSIVSTQWKQHIQLMCHT